VFIYSVARHGAESTADHACGDRDGRSESGCDAEYGAGGKPDAGADSFAVAKSNCEPDARSESESEWDSESVTSAESNADSVAW